LTEQQPKQEGILNTKNRLQQ